MNYRTQIEFYIEFKHSFYTYKLLISKNCSQQFEVGTYNIKSLDRQKGRKTDRQKVRKIERQKDRKTERQMDRKTERQKDNK